MYTVIKSRENWKRERESKREREREREQGFDCELLTRTVRKREPTSGTN